MCISFTLCVTFNVTCIKLFQALPPEASEAFGTVLVRGTEWLRRLDLIEDCKISAILKGLRAAKEFDLPAEQTNGESLISGVTLSGVEFDKDSVQPSTLFFRKFYPALLKNLLKTSFDRKPWDFQIMASLVHSLLCGQWKCGERIQPKTYCSSSCRESIGIHIS